MLHILHIYCINYQYGIVNTGTINKELDWKNIYIIGVNKILSIPIPTSYSQLKKLIMCCLTWNKTVWGFYRANDLTNLLNTPHWLSSSKSSGSTTPKHCSSSRLLASFIGGKILLQVQDHCSQNTAFTSFQNNQYGHKWNIITVEYWEKEMGGKTFESRANSLDSVKLLMFN